MQIESLSVKSAIVEPRVAFTPETPITAEITKTQAITHDDLFRLRAVFWCVAAAVGLITVLADRFTMNLDGVSYLDVGDAYLRGDFKMATNAQWSPLYAWVLGIGDVLTGDSPYTEFAVAHLINFLIFLGATASFDFLLQELIRSKREREAAGEFANLSARSWIVLGFTLFIWSSVEFIPLRLMTPDMCVAAIIYLAAALTLRINRGAASVTTYLLLGGVLALGYYAKAAMFPLAFVFLCVNLFTARNRATDNTHERRALMNDVMNDVKRNAPRIALAAIVFLALAAPLVVALSWQKNRLTFSDSGKLAYGWFVNDVALTHWRGENNRFGVPVHPVRTLYENPTVYEYGSPVGGTYPVWYDPSYWYEGITPRFNLSAQAGAIAGNLAKYYKMQLSHLQSSLVVGFLILLLYAKRNFLTTLRNFAAQWCLLVPAIAGFVMYALVYTEERYVGAFYVLLWLGLFATVRLARASESARLTRAVSLVIAGMLLLMTTIETAPKAYAAGREIMRGQMSLTHPQKKIVESLKGLGVQPGERIAVLHPGNVLGSLSRIVALARIARVQIVAGIKPEDAKEFWASDEATQAEVIQALARSDARFILVENPPATASLEGWQPVGKSKFYLYELAK